MIRVSMHVEEAGEQHRRLRQRITSVYLCVCLLVCVNVCDTVCVGVFGCVWAGVCACVSPVETIERHAIS